MGVPVVTLEGKAHVSRVGVSLLNRVQLAELIARNADEYVRIAVELAGDVPRLCGISSSLRQRMKEDGLLNSEGFVQHLEDAFRQMWCEYCSH
jgi:protein O-GlcNAc transferase